MTDRSVPYLELHFTNITLENIIPYSRSLFDIEIGPFSYLIIKNVTIKSMDFSGSPCIKIRKSLNFTIDGLYFLDIALDSNILFQAAVNNLYATDIIFDSITGDSHLDNIFNVDYSGVVYLTKITVINTPVQFSESFFNFNAKSKGSITFLNSTFNSIYLDPTANLITSSSMYFADINSLIFTNITSNQESDFTNIMINFQSINVESGLNITLSDIEVESSQISVFKISRSVVSTSLDQYITIRNVLIKNCEYEFSMNLVEFGQIQPNGVFHITIDNITFQDITFIRGGNLILFKHQTKERLTIQNSSFQNIYYGSISVESYDQTENSESTKIELSNITAHNIDAMFLSFIQLYQGSDVLINSSNFTHISNTISGAVLTAGYQKTTTSIYNSNFSNNTSVEGGVFMVQSESTIKIYN